MKIYAETLIVINAEVLRGYIVMYKQLQRASVW